MDDQVRSINTPSHTPTHTNTSSHTPSYTPPLNTPIKRTFSHSHPLSTPSPQHRSRQYHCRRSRGGFSRCFHDIIRHLCLPRLNARRHSICYAVYHHRLPFPRFLQSVHYQHSVRRVFCDGGRPCFYVNHHWIV